MKRFLSVYLILFCAANLDATAATIFESGTLGPTGLTFNDFPFTPGPFVSDVRFMGVRFQLTDRVTTERIGGHFVLDPGHDDSFFGAITRLDSGSDFPDSGDLSTPDVLGETLLAFPVTSAEVFGELQLSLDPGWYALVFGSGLFGTAGRGTAPRYNPVVGSPSYVGYLKGSGWSQLTTSSPGPLGNFRLVVEGHSIPEPSSISVAMLAIGYLFASRTIQYRDSCTSLGTFDCRKNRPNLSREFNGQESWCRLE